jgi:hypothetical protein
MFNRTKKYPTNEELLEWYSRGCRDKESRYPLLEHAIKELPKWAQTPYRLGVLNTPAWEAKGIERESLTIYCGLEK